jgi:hypothetical protein
MRTVIVSAIAVVGLYAQEPAPLQEPWEGVPAAFRNLPVGRLKIPASQA